MPRGAHAVPLHDGFPYGVAHARFHLARTTHIGIPALLLQVLACLQHDREAASRAVWNGSRDCGTWRVEHYPLYLLGVLRRITADARAACGPADDMDALHPIRSAQVVDHAVHFGPVVAYRVEVVSIVGSAGRAQGPTSQQ